MIRVVDGLRGGQTKTEYEYITDARVQAWAVGSIGDQTTGYVVIELMAGKFACSLSLSIT